MAKKLDKYSDLQSILSKELGYNGARIKCIALLITALIKVQNVNFERLAQGFDNPIQLGSNLRRIQRFFAGFDLPRDPVARLLFKLLPVAGHCRLAPDRTNWKFGTRNVNILILGVIYKGLSLPILWTILDDKRGNSDQAGHTEKGLGYYKERWQIETMFKAFKTNGFNLESTHLKEYERIDKLLTILSLAFS